MSKAVEEKLNKSEIHTVVLIVVVIAVAVGLALLELKRDKERYALEAMKIHQVMTGEKYVASCEAIRRIDTGVPVKSTKCYGTATCAATDNESGLTIYNAMSGQRIQKLHATTDRMKPYYSYGADYQEFHDICIAGVKA
ncbi:hypothetical protein [Mesorhizobium sp. SP-1A]|uniref:hypothetical protein n=1 Tax=Mesorhizobium sp. SP-1A TaxID=3077840 RepID=UPI0028F736A1|nr:hypothetical protein [Mesorhizobium sp. SP-1A]